jgi:hypothetical protein
MAESLPTQMAADLTVGELPYPPALGDLTTVWVCPSCDTPGRPGPCERVVVHMDGGVPAAWGGKDGPELRVLVIPLEPVLKPAGWPGVRTLDPSGVRTEGDALTITAFRLAWAMEQARTHLRKRREAEYELAGACATIRALEALVEQQKAQIEAAK